LCVLHGAPAPVPVSCIIERRLFALLRLNVPEHLLQVFDAFGIFAHFVPLRAAISSFAKR
jgi:hypothetical protein